MPELPEVETVARDLAEKIVGRSIAGFWTDNPAMLRGKPAAEFAYAINGARLAAVNRRGKQLLLNLSNGLTLVIHLKMTGQLLVMPTGSPVQQWTHAIVELDGGIDLRFRDIRKFGYFDLVETERIGTTGEKMPGLGPEPLDRGFTKGVFDWSIKRHPHAKIKALLMNQSFLAGIGNIYADEALYYAGVRPTRPAGRLTAAERDRLYTGIRRILTDAIEKRGTTFSTFVDASGQPGGYVSSLKVYGRTGEPCVKRGCGTVKKVKVAGRSSHYCPKCQK